MFRHLVPTTAIILVFSMCAPKDDSGDSSGRQTQPDLERVCAHGKAIMEQDFEGTQGAKERIDSWTNNCLNNTGMDADYRMCVLAAKNAKAIFECP